MDDIYLDALQNFLNGSEWRDNIRVFVNAHRKYFSNITDLHHSQHLIWQNFQDVGEAIINDALSIVGGNIEELENALDKVQSRESRGPRDEVIKDVINQLLTFEDFELFAQMMHQACLEYCQDFNEDLENNKYDQLMRLDFKILDIEDAFSQLGTHSQLEEVVIFLSDRQSNPQISESNYHSEAKNEYNLYEYSFQDEKVQSDIYAESKEEPQDSFKGERPELDKFIQEAREEGFVIDINELNAKFVIADSVLESYQQTTIDSENTSSNSASDSLLELAKWAADMRTLNEDIYVAYQQEILCKDMVFNCSKGLIQWYNELETYRQELNNGDHSAWISDEELQRMTDLDRIASLGTEDEKRLHYLLSRHEEVRKEINNFYRKCTVLISACHIPRAQIEEAYLILKETVNDTKSDLYLNFEHEAIVRVMNYPGGNEIIHLLIKLHVLEDEQIMLKLEIQRYINSPSSAANQSEDKVSSSSDVMIQMDALFDSNLLQSKDESDITISLPSDSKLSSHNIPMQDNKLDFPSEEKSYANNYSASEPLLDAKSDVIIQSEDKAASIFPPIVAIKQKQEDSNSYEHLLEELKAKQRKSLEDLKQSLLHQKQQQLKSLEDRLLRKKLYKKQQFNQLSLEEQELLNQEIENLETQIQSFQENLDRDHDQIIDGFKQKCLLDLKNIRNILSESSSKEPIRSLDDLLTIIQSDSDNADSEDPYLAKLKAKYLKSQEELFQQLQSKQRKQQMKLLKMLEKRKQQNQFKDDYTAEDIQVESQYVKDQIQEIENKLGQEYVIKAEELQNKIMNEMLGAQLLPLANIIASTNQKEDNDNADDYLDEGKDKISNNQLGIISNLHGLSSIKEAYNNTSKKLTQELLAKKEHQANKLSLLRQQKNAHKQLVMQDIENVRDLKQYLEETKPIEASDQVASLESDTSGQDIIQIMDNVVLDAFHRHLNDAHSSSRQNDELNSPNSALRDPSIHSMSVKSSLNDQAPPINHKETYERIKVEILESFEKSKQQQATSLAERKQTQKQKLHQKIQARKKNQQNGQDNATSNDSNVSWNPDVEHMLENVIESYLNNDMIHTKISQEADKTASPKKKVSSYDNSLDDKEEEMKRNKMMKDKLVDAHKTKEQALVDDLYANMMEKKKKLEERIQKKKIQKDKNIEPKVAWDSSDAPSKSTLEEEKEDLEDVKKLQEKIASLEKAFDKVKASVLTGSQAIDPNEPISVDKLVEIMEQNANINNSHLASASMDPSDQSSRRQSFVNEIDRQHHLGEAKRISTTYLEEKQKLDMKMEIEKARHKQALQRKLWEKNQQKALLNAQAKASALRPLNATKGAGYSIDLEHDEEDLVIEDDDEDEPAPLAPQEGIQLGRFQSVLKNLRANSQHLVMKGGDVPIVIPNAQQQSSIAMRGLSLSPMKKHK